MLKRFSLPGRFWIRFSFTLVLFSIIWTGVTLAQTIETPLMFIDSDPPDQAIDVELEPIFQLTFDQPLPTDLERIQVTGRALDPQYTIQVDQLNQIQVETSAAPDPDLVFDTRADQLLLQPTEPLLYSTNYLLLIPSQPGLPLAADLELTFKTRPEFTYNGDVLPLLDAACVGCHRPQAPLLRSPLHTYGAVGEFVQPGAASSPLLDPRWTRRHARTAPGNPRSGSATRYIRGPNQIPGYEDLYTFTQLGQWTPDQVNLIATWIIRDDAAESTGAQPPPRRFGVRYPG